MHLPVMVLLIAGILASFLTFKTFIPKTKLISPISNQKVEQNKQNIFEDKNLGFSLQIPSGYELESITEQKFFDISKADYRKNFKYYVTYDPPKVLKIWDSSHFSLWVFDNPDNLSIEAWYKDFWYYPFIWGQFNPPDKAKIAPTKEGVVVDYQPGKPKFMYISHQNKMFLMRILGEPGEKILNSVKLN